MLQLGPFHWINTLPRSSKKTSPLLKLSQESATCHREEREFGKVRGGQGELQVTSHSHGKPVPGDLRTGLLILLALSSSLSTLMATPNPQVRTWKLSWNGSSWEEMRYLPGKSTQKWVREEREGEMIHKKSKVFFLPLWLTRASCPWHEEDAWCCTCWSPRA